MPSQEEQDSAIDLLKNIGQVMVTWQGIESLVFDVFRYFFAPDHYDVAAVAFFAVQALETRMQMIDALMAQFANEQQIGDWSLIHKKIRKKSKGRNIAAHGNFVFFGKHPKRKAFLGKSTFDIGKFPKAPAEKDFYSHKELEEWAKSFILLSKDVHDFLSELKQDQALLLKLRARPQRVEESDQLYPRVYHIPQAP